VTPQPLVEPWPHNALESRRYEYIQGAAPTGNDSTTEGWPYGGPFSTCRNDGRRTTTAKQASGQRAG
jgi:hypothetical protein